MFVNGVIVLDRVWSLREKAFLTLKEPNLLKKNAVFLPLTRSFGCHDPALASTLMKKRFLTEEQGFPED